MTWDEFSDLVSGLNEQTPLVRVAQIRTETDREALKRLTPGQLAMRSEWQRRRALRRPESETMAFVADMQRSIAGMFGGDDG